MEQNVSVARTGYTGEDGVEVFFRAKDAAKFWNAVLEKGKAVWNQTVRPRRARHLATRNAVIRSTAPIFRLNEIRSKPASVFCRSNEAKFHWPRSFVEDERKRLARKARCVSNEGKRSAAAAALFGFR